jgi:hypothetical protein
MKDVASDIVYSKAKVELNFMGSGLREALNFGFSYIESEDHIVEYIVANCTVMQSVLVEIPEAKLFPEKDSIGELWTAKLFISDRLKNSEIIFSNNTFSAVINLNMDKIRSNSNAYI